MRNLILVCALACLSGCAVLTIPPNDGARSIRFGNFKATEYTSSTSAFKAGCTGRPLSTPGQRLRCGLKPL